MDLKVRIFVVVEINIIIFFQRVQTKKRFKYVFYFHFILFSLVLIQTSLYYCHIHYARSKCFGLPQLPRPQKWQLVWMPSFLAMLLGYISLSKNRILTMKFCFYGTFLFGLGSILGTMILNGDTIFQQMNEMNKKSHLNKKSAFISSTTHFCGIPLKVLWCLFLVVCLQIHVFSIYFSRVLIKIWSEEKRKKQ